MENITAKKVVINYNKELLDSILNVIMILDVLHRSKKPMMMLKSRRIE